MDSVAKMAIGLQTATTLLVAIVALSLHRVIGRRFLRSWAMSWVALAIGLVALDFGLEFPFGSRIFYACFWVAGNLFGFLLFVGCRDYVEQTPMHRSDAWLIGLPVALGIWLPFVFPNLEQIIPFHSLFIGGFCLMSLLQTFHFQSQEGQTRIGLRLLQASLIGMVILFWHYTLVLGSHWYGVERTALPAYMKYSSLYDAYLELALAFAQVLLATDSVRRELAETNRQLARATDHLALAARTDALTGLLNRRAYDAMLADSAVRPEPGCVGMVDLNDLKPLNDRHGHAVGDVALRAVARMLQTRTRLGDPVFRLGGDEFLVVLSGVSVEELSRRLADADESLAKTRLPGLSDAIGLSIAWGVAEYDGVNLTYAVEQADAAMYANKQKRKNHSRG